jgi:hypothetical protein
VKSATSKNFLAKWSFNLLNEVGDSLCKQKTERKGEGLSENSGFGYKAFLSHEEFLKKAKETERITVVCKVSITNKGLCQ